MTNAERILRQFDQGLDHEIRLVLYGRAAIVLGYPNAPADLARTLDVDVIVPESDAGRLAADENFWASQEAANRALEKEGLYLTHIFEARQVFLRRSWEEHLVRLVRPPARWLRLYRPAALDLVLTKMMRGDDPQDLADAGFLIRQERLGPDDLEAAFREAVIPEIPELQAEFEKAKPRVLALARQSAA